MNKKFKEKYLKHIIFLKKALGRTNIMSLPKMEKIVLSACVSSALENRKDLDLVMEEFSIITGQRPMYTRVKKSLANFKIREGNVIGCKVTLRGQKMYDFFERFIRITIPRIRDFNGLSVKAFDGFGNYSLGIKEQIVFPEIDSNKIEKTNGMNITFVLNSRNDRESQIFLKNLGMPFKE